MRSVTELIASLGGRTRVAAALGAPYGTVNRWYCDDRIPSRDQAARLAAMAGVDVAEIWSDKQTAADRRRWYIEAAINDLERCAASVDMARRVEIKRTISGLYSVLAHLSPRRYVGAIDVPGVANHDAE